MVDGTQEFNSFLDNLLGDLSKISTSQVYETQEVSGMKEMSSNSESKEVTTSSGKQIVTDQMLPTSTVDVTKTVSYPEHLGQISHTNYHEFSPQHWAWAIVNGRGNMTTERKDSGDKNAKHNPQVWFVPKALEYPGIEIKPYVGTLSPHWGDLARGEAGKALRWIYGIMREITPYGYRREMAKFRAWTRMKWRFFEKVMEFHDPFSKEMAELGRIPVFIGRDCYHLAYAFHCLGQPYFYIEGVSRTIAKNISPEFVAEFTKGADINALCYIDTGFSGTIPKAILHGVYNIHSASPLGNYKEDPMYKIGGYQCNHFYLLSSGTDEIVKAYASPNYIPERAPYMRTNNPNYYRSLVIELEYSPKIYLRPVQFKPEKEDVAIAGNALSPKKGRPIMQPSGDAIKSALMSVAILSYLEKKYGKLKGLEVSAERPHALNWVVPTKKGPNMSPEELTQAVNIIFDKTMVKLSNSMSGLLSPTI